jgi:hypothetical protein
MPWIVFSGYVGLAFFGPGRAEDLTKAGIPRISEQPLKPKSSPLPRAISHEIESSLKRWRQKDLFRFA